MADDKNTNSDGCEYSEYKRDEAGESPARDQLANSEGSMLDHTPQAPSSIPVEQVDDGNIPYNGNASKAHGPRGGQPSL